MMYFWLIVVILLSIIEIATTDIVTIWYVISGIATIILSLFIDSTLIQFAFFTIIGTVLLITTRPILKKLLKIKNVKTNYDRIIGMEGVVTETIKENEIGEVKVDGKKWSAISDEEIKKDSVVIILNIEGVKLRVKQK